MDNMSLMNIPGVLMLGILVYFAATSTMLSRGKARLFIFTAIINASLILLEVGDYLLSTAAFDGAYIWHSAVLGLGFGIYPFVTCLLFCLFRPNFRPSRVIIPSLLNLALCISSCFNGLVFNLSADNVYSRGPLFAVPLLLCGAYMLLLTVATLRKIKNISQTETTLVFIFIVCAILCEVIQIALHCYFIVWNCSAMVITMYYLFLHIQYFKTDALTGAYNRHIFESDLTKLLKNPDAAIVVLDLNGLKKINDKYGHTAGDSFIQYVAQTLAEKFTGIGLVYRIGGDEFVVMCGEITETQLTDVLQQVDDKLDSEGYGAAHGYAFCRQAEDAHGAFKLADDAMYANKRRKKENLCKK